VDEEVELRKLILCFVDHLWYICVIQTNLMHYLSSVYFVCQPLRIFGTFVAHHQEVYCIYATVGTCCALQLKYHLSYIYSKATDMPETCRGWLTK
jgi:hypothetical protein